MQFRGDKLSKITPLMEAAASSSETIVRRLLELGADPNVASIPNCNTALIYAASTDGRDVVREILMTEGPKKPDVYLINNHYHDAMMEVALVGGTDTLKEFLEMGYRPRFLNLRQQERVSFRISISKKGLIKRKFHRKFVYIFQIITKIICFLWKKDIVFLNCKSYKTYIDIKL